MLLTLLTIQLTLWTITLTTALATHATLTTLWALEKTRIWCGWRPAHTYTAWDFFGPRK